MSEIRVTYSGLISILTSLSTVITGLVFLMIVTRQLSPEELGTWSLIGGLISYVIIIEPIVSYWTTREIARGEKSAKTSLMSSGLFSIFGMAAYFVIALFVGNQTDADTSILFYGVLLVPLNFINKTLGAIALAWKPQIIGFGLLAFEFTKIPTGFVFVYVYDLGVLGAIFAVSISYVISISVLLIYSKPILQEKFTAKYIKKWLKFFWLPSYIKFSNTMVLDVLIFSLITGSVFGLSYWTAAIAIAALVSHTSQLSKAVYPKLLSGGKTEYVEKNLSVLFYFSFPLIALSITFAKPGLFALNPIYEVASLVVIFLSIRAFLKSIQNVFVGAIRGLEKIDTTENMSHKEILKSKLFHLPTIRIIHQGTYLGSLAIVLVLFNSSEQLDLVIYWSVVALISQIPFTFYFYYLARKNFSINLEKSSTIKYLLSSIFIFLIIYVIMEENLEYQKEILIFLPNLVFYVLISVGSYVGITYILDRKTRNLVKSIIKELKK